MTLSDPHNCQALGQGATISSSDLTPEPFAAWQVIGSSTYSFYNHSGVSDTIVAYQPDPTLWFKTPQSNFDKAGWDGYGNPFQCVELIARYNALKFADGHHWGD